jgi:hypothetical protein
LLFKRSMGTIKMTQFYESDRLDKRRNQGRDIYFNRAMTFQLDAQSSEQKLHIFYEWVVSLRELVDRNLGTEGTIVWK